MSSCSPFDTFWKDEKPAHEGVKFNFDDRWFFEYEGKKYITTFTMKYVGVDNVQYEEMKTRLQKPHLKRGKLEMSTKTALEIGIKLFVNCVLVNWENFEERRPGKREAAIAEHGVPIIPFSKENATEIFTAMPDFVDVLQELASEPSNFQIATPDEQKKLGNGFPPITPTN